MLVFAWLMFLNRLLTIDNLQKKGWQLVGRCEMCKQEVETVKHLFNSCHVTLTIYQQLAAVTELVQPLSVRTRAILQHTQQENKRDNYHSVVCGVAREMLPYL